jgi:hypothetical protein
MTIWLEEISPKFMSSGVPILRPKKTRQVGAIFAAGVRGKMSRRNRF